MKCVSLHYAFMHFCPFPILSSKKTVFMLFFTIFVHKFFNCHMVYKNLIHSHINANLKNRYLAKIIKKWVNFLKNFIKNIINEFCNLQLESVTWSLKSNVWLNCFNLSRQNFADLFFVCCLYFHRSFTSLFRLALCRFSKISCSQIRRLLVFDECFSEFFMFTRNNIYCKNDFTHQRLNI